jgi:alcohol dehydrogenase YqhD (iron-dependent ADH family)
VWDFFEKRIWVTKAVPLGCVLTIPAAGSESSPSMVITDEITEFKKGADGDGFIPRFALVNPETNFTLPDYQTACGCSDILAHLMERYFTNVQDVDFTDRMLEAAMRTILINAPLALRRPTDYNLRAELNFCGSIAHNGLLNSGRVGDWASHQIEHEVSAIYDVAHGAGLSVVFPAWMKYVYKHNIDRFTQFAVRVMDVDIAFEKRDDMVLEAIHRLEDFYREIGLPIRLSDMNVDASRVREMADKTCAYVEHIGNFVELHPDDVSEILTLAL